MGAADFSQLLLLLTKNLKIKVLRSPLSFLLEIFLPVGIGTILLWARGYVAPEPMEGFTMPEFEFERWPAGLDVGYANSTGDDEFMLFYAPSNEKLDELVDDAVDKLNNDYAKWYSFESYLFDQILYKPILEVANRDNLNETSWDLLETYVKGYGIKLSENDKNTYLYGDTAKCNRDPNTWGCQNGVSASSVEEKQEFIENKVIVQVKKQTWGHCTRPLLFQEVVKMAKFMACHSVTGVQARSGSASSRSQAYQAEDSVIQSYLDQMTEETMSLFRPDRGNCDFDPEQRKYDSFWSKFNHQRTESQTCVATSTDQMIGRIKQTLRNAARNSPTPDLQQFCSAASPNPGAGYPGWVLLSQLSAVAQEVHDVSPKLRVSKMGFASKEEMALFFLNSENDQIARRRLAAIEFENAEDFVTDFGKSLDYTIRPPASEVNSYAKYSNDFERQKNQESAVTPGMYWRSLMLKMAVQVNVPRITPQTRQLMCGGNQPNYYKEGVAMIQQSLDKSFINKRVNHTEIDNFRFKGNLWIKNYAKNFNFATGGDRRRDFRRLRTHLKKIACDCQIFWHLPASFRMLLKHSRTLIDPSRTLLNPSRTFHYQSRTLRDPSRTLQDESRTLQNPSRIWHNWSQKIWPNFH